MLVVCCHKECRRWSVAYTTRDENPDPWPALPLHPVLGHMGLETPLWYACEDHVTDKHHPLPEGDQAPACERCGLTAGVVWAGGMTAYEYRVTAWERIMYEPHLPPDPNRECPYCHDCAEDYYSYWNDQWRDYRDSALGA